METTDISKFGHRTRDSIRVLALFKAKKGKGHDLEKILLELVAPTRSEDGNISYILHRHIRNPDLLLFDEMWTSQMSLEEHLKKPYIVSLDAKVESLVEEPVKIEIFVEV